MPTSPHITIYHKAPKVPPDCRPWKSKRINITALLALLFLLIHFPTVSASPFAISGSHIHLHARQAIPDSTGNTGIVPAPIKPEPPACPPPLSPPRPTITATTTPSPSPTPRPTSAPRGGPTDTTNAPTTPPADEIRLTRTNPILSPGTLAGIVAGSSIALLLLIALAIFILRRHRRPEITEIPIRRSRLGSLLRHRMFNSPLPPSRASSRSSGRTLTGDARKGPGWVRKDSIGRPSTGRVGERDAEMLRVPQAAFMKSERESVEKDGGERWVGLEISEPRPVRPVSAEPLGRLSGMGMGMGYLK